MDTATTDFAGISGDKWGNFRCTECDRFISASDQERGRLIRHANHCQGKAQAVTAPVAIPAGELDVRAR